MLQRVKGALKVLLGRAHAINIQRTIEEKRHYCPVCKSYDISFVPLPFSYFKAFDKYQYIHSVFQKETLNIEAYTCNNCKASDRDRLYALYFDRIFTKNNDQKLRLLDIAPAPALTGFLKSIQQLEVRTADLFMKGVDDTVDITDMTMYADEQFDIFICSHVLEHIKEDVMAMQELYRILKKGGWGIAMVPVDLGLTDIYENFSVKDAAGRWKHFGQDDHVRMYSKQGFMYRLQHVGFTVKQFDISFFGAEAFERSGIHPRSVLYIVCK